jgi:HAD superfamily hydrolase (TIGR01450 family)
MTASLTRAGAAPDLDVRLARVHGVVFDVDGCLVLSDEPGGEGGSALPGAAEAVRAVRASGRSVVAFTNASSQVPAAIAASLSALGVELSETEVLTPSVVAAQVIRERYGDAPVLAFGGPGVVDVLRDGGVTLADHARPTEAAAVVVGWDTGFDRDRLQTAAEALWNGAALLVTSDARRFASQTRPMAGVGGFIARGLSYVAETDYEVVGKPSPTAMAVASHRLGTAPEHVLVAGDDLTLEAAMAHPAGAVGVLVTTGLHGSADVGAVEGGAVPDLVVPGLPELVHRLLTADRRHGRHRRDQAPA